MKIQKKNKNLNKKICNIKFCFGKKKSRTHISEFLFKNSFVFSVGIGCSDMVPKAIALKGKSKSNFVLTPTLRLFQPLAQTQPPKLFPEPLRP